LEILGGRKVYCKMKDDLLVAIQKKREVMVKTANAKGTNNEETIKLSQELDILIYKYQLEIRDRKRKNVTINKPFLEGRIIWSTRSKYRLKKYSEVMYWN